MELHESNQLNDFTDWEILRLGEDGYFLIREDGIKLEFALAEFSSSDLEEKDVTISFIFHGYGYTGNLKECRHIWWGENTRSPDGYCYYLDRSLVRKAMDELDKYFND